MTERSKLTKASEQLQAVRVALGQGQATAEMQSAPQGAVYNETIVHALLQAAESLVETVQSRRTENADSADRVAKIEIQLGHIASSLGSLTDLVSEHRQEQQNTQKQLNQVESKCEYLVKDVGNLCKVVRDGNGQPSIVQRQANMETTLTSQAKNLEQLAQYANATTASRMLSKTQLVAGLGGMLFTALLAGMALIAAMMKN
jgi:septal ring factor EnvC (AmiA/AmiB activator)